MPLGRSREKKTIRPGYHRQQTPYLLLVVYAMLHETLIEREKNKAHPGQRPGWKKTIRVAMHSRLLSFLLQTCFSFSQNPMILWYSSLFS